MVNPTTTWAPGPDPFLEGPQVHPLDPPAVVEFLAGQPAYAVGDHVVVTAARVWHGEQVTGMPVLPDEIERVDDEALATARAGAAAIRALIDPMSGRIDNWSQR